MKFVNGKDYPMYYGKIKAMFETTSQIYNICILCIYLSYMIYIYDIHIYIYDIYLSYMIYIYRYITFHPRDILVFAKRKRLPPPRERRVWTPGCGDVVPGFTGGFTVTVEPLGPGLVNIEKAIEHGHL